MTAKRRLATFNRSLGLPFIAAAAAIGPFMRASTAVKKQFGKIEKTVGVLLIATASPSSPAGFRAHRSGLFRSSGRWGEVLPLRSVEGPRIQEPDAGD